MSKTVEVTVENMDGTETKETFCEACLRSLISGDPCEEHDSEEEEE